MPPFYRIQVRRGTTADWTAADPVLASGEFGFDTTLERFKIGNGGDPWSGLAFVDDISWSDVTGKPPKFAPSSHSSSHAKGAIDALVNQTQALTLTGSVITGNANDVAVTGTADVVRLTSAAAIDVTGIVAQANGTTLLLYNGNTTAGHDITLKHLDTESATANRMSSPTATDYVITSNGGAAVLVYDGISGFWRLI